MQESSLLSRAIEQKNKQTQEKITALSVKDSLDDINNTLQAQVSDLSALSENIKNLANGVQTTLSNVAQSLNQDLTATSAQAEHLGESMTNLSQQIASFQEQIQSQQNNIQSQTESLQTAQAQLIQLIESLSQTIEQTLTAGLERSNEQIQQNLDNQLAIHQNMITQATQGIHQEILQASKQMGKTISHQVQRQVAENINMKAIFWMMALLTLLMTTVFTTFYAYTSKVFHWWHTALAIFITLALTVLGRTIIPIFYEIWLNHQDNQD